MRATALLLAGLLLALAPGAGAAAGADAHAPPATGQTPTPAGAAAAPSADDPQLARAREDVFAGGARSTAAIPVLQKILAANPQSAEAHMLMGLARAGEESRDMQGEAVAELRQALDIAPGLLPARLYLARVYLDLGQADRARDEMTTALTQAPGQPQFMAVQAEAERQLGNPQRAVDITQQVLAADPTFLQARYYLGLALLDLHHRTEGIDQLEQVVRTGAQIADVYFSLGVAYLEADRTDQAIGALTSGLALEPSKPDVRIKLAGAYRAKGQLTKADEQLDLALPPGGARQFSAFYQGVQADLLVERGRIRLQQGRLRDAVAAFTQALDIQPDLGAAHRYLATAYQRQGLRAKALEQAQLAAQYGAPLPSGEQQAIEGPAAAPAARPSP
jgi:tetratricopeptide (TPR) repeat protein